MITPALSAREHSKHLLENALTCPAPNRAHGTGLENWLIYAL